MYENINKTGRCHLNFPDKGVEILIPPQKDGIKVTAEIITLSELKYKEGGFVPHRGVIKFEVLNKSDKVVNTFSPPLVLIVFFTKEDRDINGPGIDLAYLPAKEDEATQIQTNWIRFTVSPNNLRKIEVDEEERAKLDVNSWAGYFIVEISECDDPSVSVGR